MWGGGGGETYVGDLGGGALRRLLGAAQLPVDAGLAPETPHTLVGGVGVATKAAVLAAHGAVVEHHCGRERQTDRHRETDRQTQRQRERDKERERERQERQSEIIY